MSNINTQMDGDSLNISEQRKKELKELFPGVFTETRNDQGKIVETLDFERLKAELGTFSDIYDNRRERYGMDWPGKRDCMRLIQEPSHATLKPCREESVDFDSTENLFIEGDNLEVLKLLQKSYYGKVKMIYIDPPYNTGKEFIYPDNYSESLDTYLEYAGLKESDGEGRKWSSNTANEGRFHTKWLNMMYPRLYLARNLLREDGVIFISIDENEQENLRRICDEIYGEENFFGVVCWQNVYGGGAKSKHIVNMNEFILIYARNKGSIDVIELPPDPEARKRYKDKDEKYDVRGPFYTQPLATNSMDERANLRFPISYEGEEIWPEKQWQWSKERVLKALDENELVIKKSKSGDWSVRYKQYLKDENGKERCSKLFSVLSGPWSQEGSNEIKDLFGNGKIFTFPKPSKLIAHLLSSFWEEKDCLVLDFFAGSSVTASAVNYLNNEFNLNYSYIMVQLPELCDENSVAFKEGYSTIADVSKERLRRSGKKLRSKLDGQLDLEGKQNIDLGFKVLKLNQSNFKLWQAPVKDISDEELIQQMELNVDHINPNASQEDLLYELLIKAGVMTTETIESIELAGHHLFSVGEGVLYIYLEDVIDQAMIDAVLEKAPGQFICLDKAFHGNDQLKANAVKTFAAFNQGREKIDQIDFKTV